MNKRQRKKAERKSRAEAEANLAALGGIPQTKQAKRSPRLTHRERRSLDATEARR